jgi:ABC-type Co2+ transport system permease subunit
MSPSSQIRSSMILIPLSVVIGVVAVVVNKWAVVIAMAIVFVLQVLLLRKARRRP